VGAELKVYHLTHVHPMNGRVSTLLPLSIFNIL
jgi:hypothetical protein